MANDFISAYTAQQIEDIFSNVTRNLTPANMLKWSSTEIVSGGGSATVRGYVYPEDYGAKGDGTTDDSTALENTITAAKNQKKAIMLTGTYLFGKCLNSYGVSWLGNGYGTLKFVGTASVGTAFIWGGDDVHVEGIIFDLTNNSGNSAMQGLRNTKNGAQRQFFIGNKVICRTVRSNGYGNIYGVWMNGQNWHDAYFMYNYFQDCCYAVQVNNMIDKGDIINNPDGDTVYNIFVEKNICVNCSLGINTPHCYCHHVFFKDNIAEAQNMPINFAHCDYFEISGNHLRSTNTTDSCLHVEDVCSRGRIHDNYIEEASIGNVMNLVNKSGASKDTVVYDDTLDIYNNTFIYTGTKTSGVSGIALSDNGSLHNRLRGNKIYNCSTGVLVNSNYTELIDTYVYNCKQAIGGQQNPYVRGLYCEGVTKICEFRHPVTIQDVVCVDCTPKLSPSSTSYHNINSYKNVQIHKNCEIQTGTLFDVIELPNTPFYGVRVKVIFGNQDSANAGADLMISFNGTDYKITVLSAHAYGAVNTSFSFAVVNNVLRIKNGLSKNVPSGKITVILEEAQYFNKGYTNTSIYFEDISDNTVTVAPTTEATGGEESGGGESGGGSTGGGADSPTVTSGLETTALKCSEINFDTGATSDTTTNTTVSSDYLDISSADRTKMYKVAATKNGEAYSITSANVYLYDADKNFIGFKSQCQKADSISFPSNVKYVRLRFKQSGGGDMSSQVSAMKASLVAGSTIDTSKYIYLIDWSYGYLSTTGEAGGTDGSTTNSIITDYVDISALDKSNTYLMTGHDTSYKCNMTQACFYTSDKTFISRTTQIHSTAFSIPSNAVYCRFRTQREDAAKITVPNRFTATIKAQ